MWKNFFQKKKRTRGHESIIQQPLLEVTQKWIPFVLIPNQFTKILQKNCKKFAKNLQKICNKIEKKLQKFCKMRKKISFCVRFLQILNLHTDFRPLEESVRDFFMSL